MKKLIIAALVLASFQLPAEQKNLFDRAKSALAHTRAGFHISRHFNKIVNGSSFTFNQIAGDPIDQNSRSIGTGAVKVSYDRCGAIQAINDGKHTPLFLGSIPYKQKHISQLKAHANHGKLSICTFNEPWECDAVGLPELIKGNNQLTQHRYPTPDMEAPSIIDLIRIVRDLKNRDSLLLVHCKAGRGRSATGIGAYLATLIHETQGMANVTQIEQYLQKRRPQVSLHSSQKEVLTAFIATLRHEGSFEKMYEKHKVAVDARDLGLQAQS